ncbi:MAG: hypothetical protein O3A47_12770 [Chloroflexi bacterium]|nr:hypothetical protein [Chloroflexota bacterium]
MSITVVFDAPGMTAVQYDEVMAELSQAGAGMPDGRLYHVASPTDSGWYVLDVWESEEKLDTFARTLMPMLAGVGVQPPQPVVMPTHNIVSG